MYIKYVLRNCIHNCTNEGGNKLKINVYKREEIVIIKLRLNSELISFLDVSFKFSANAWVLSGSFNYLLYCFNCVRFYPYVVESLFSMKRIDNFVL